MHISFKHFEKLKSNIQICCVNIYMHLMFIFVWRIQLNKLTCFSRVQLQCAFICAYFCSIFSAGFLRWPAHCAAAATFWR